MLPIKDTIPSRNPAIMTYTLILVNAMVFFFQATMPEQTLEEFVHLFGIVPARYTHPEWAKYVGFPVGDYLPFLTHMFMHGGWLHILSSMWSLWIFGDNVEDRMGFHNRCAGSLLSNRCHSAIHANVITCDDASKENP
ncbi:MAG TPA: rhomboid family intramembrane serine protease [Terrimicrobiaceae bacterium]